MNRKSVVEISVIDTFHRTLEDIFNKQENWIVLFILELKRHLDTYFVNHNMSCLEELNRVLQDSNIHEQFDGYTGNCANIAVAVSDIALEEYSNDYFRFAILDRPSKLFDRNCPDHVALEYNGRYLDSKGIHSRSELINNIQGDTEHNKPVLQIEDRSFVTSIDYYNSDTMKDIKSEILKKV